MYQERQLDLRIMGDQLLAILADILKIGLPASLAVYGMYLTIRSYATREMEKALIDLKTKSDGINATTKLQAIERWVLFLERTAPQNLFLRENLPEASVGYWQSHLNQVVNQEFMHNVSSQIYLSEQSWAEIRSAMQMVLTMINTAAAELDPNAPAIRLAERVFENVVNAGGGDPTANALKVLRDEARMIIQ